ncbi:MAG: hypothetical protein ACFFCF_08865 [Promethearchaeota archaeon]
MCDDESYSSGLELCGMDSRNRVEGCLITVLLSFLLVSPVVVVARAHRSFQSIDAGIASAYNFISTICYDYNYGGHYQELDQFGNPIQRNKFLGIEAAVILGCLRYFYTTGDLSALNHAIETFNTIEAKMRNPSHTYNARMVEDWSSAIVWNSRTADNSHLICALVELFKHTGNTTYYDTAAWLMYFIHDFHHNLDHGGYHIEVDGFGNPNLIYYPFGYLPPIVALACGALLSIDPSNTTFLEELNYALNFAQRVYWDSPYGGYCQVYTPSGAIYDSTKPLHAQSLMIQAFLIGYRFTLNMTYWNHAKEIANHLLGYWTDANLGFMTRVTRQLEPEDFNRNSAYLAYTAKAFFDLYHLTKNLSYWEMHLGCVEFIRSHHYDPSNVGFYAICDADGNPVDTTKKPGYQSDILSALILSTPTFSLDPVSQLILVTGGIIIGILVLVLVGLLVHRRRKMMKL